MEKSTVLDDLVALSRWLGDPVNDCAILGEGNTSARVSDSTFLVKASGTELRTVDSAGFVEMDLNKSVEMLEQDFQDDEQVRHALNEGKVGLDERMPSVETSLHAVCLGLSGVDFVGHTHPTAINAFTCSNQFQSVLEGRLFPDEIVVCGVRPLLVPYVDPGVALANEVRARLIAFVDEFGEAPKEIYLQNHGLIALGSSAKQVRSITAMAVKAARIRLGTQAFGGPNPLTPENVNRIHTRPDEHYRQRIIKQAKNL